MADPYELLDALMGGNFRNRLGDAGDLDAQSGYVPPGVRRHPAIAPDRTAPEHPGARMLRDAAAAIPPAPKRGDFLDHVPAWSDMLPPALRSGANWSEGSPQTPDMLSPTVMAGAGAMATRAAKPLTSTENLANKARRWGEAVALHQRNEVKQGNPEGFPVGLGAFGLSTAAALSGWPVVSGLGVGGAILTNPASVLMSPHFADIRNIARYLRAMELREAKKHPSPDNGGTTLYANPASLPVTQEEDPRNRLINALADDPLDPYRSRLADAGAFAQPALRNSMPYSPGERESTQVDDRRPQMPGTDQELLDRYNRLGSGARTPEARAEQSSLLYEMERRGLVQLERRGGK